MFPVPAVPHEEYLPPNIHIGYDPADPHIIQTIIILTPPVAIETLATVDVETEVKL
jgi:hypothetical protein